ncbi:MAG TPA: DEAD/DEAH box helicase, partial [Candidatus Limnocylindrales bacterium]|nr:DEAD/DEAH box helicase [Candidatus Limnocylindrales bacterium]
MTAPSVDPHAADEGAATILDASLLDLQIVPKRVANILGSRLALHTVRDLLFHLPRQHDDFSRQMTLRQLREKAVEGPVSATVTVNDLRVEQGFRRRIQRTVARISDDTGEGEAIWFGRRYIERRLKPGEEVLLSGKVELRGWVPRFQNPEFGAATPDALHAGRIVPVYRLTAGVTGAYLRQRIRTVLDMALPAYAEYLPRQVRSLAGSDAPPISDAIEWMHFPQDFGKLERALQRLAFDELLALQIGMVARQRQRRSERTDPIDVSDDHAKRAVSGVEQVISRQVSARRGVTEQINLTDDQRKAVADIRSDLRSGRPMMRLIQGDVGSGKTAVAALALAAVADVGSQGALLAPTDLLARQHHVTLSALLEPLGHGVTLLTGSLGVAQRREALQLLGAPVAMATSGRSLGRVVVGTHALVQDAVAFEDLRLVVVDEQ